MTEDSAGAVGPGRDSRSMGGAFVRFTQRLADTPELGIMGTTEPVFRGDLRRLKALGPKCNWIPQAVEPSRVAKMAGSSNCRLAQRAA